MGRILAIDYGRKRVGLAVTDSLQIIANPLTTVHSKDIFEYLKTYLQTEPVDAFVLGYAKQMNNTDSESMKYIKPFADKLKKTFPNVKFVYIDERFTSKMAQRSLIDAGAKKKTRQKKELLDKISATIILQTYLKQKNNNII
ncbi:MAG: Holliday junction resolvase RuvX [Bacteroidetes bacterium]|nr:MAG: Holliday junction resolvase RuvX [Bacteroidota bacterium]